MKFQNIHAHFDDFEFTAAGTFELCRRTREDFSAQVVVCTDGAAGHHLLTREETARIRLEEQRASARIGGYQLRCLTYPDGTLPREACMRAGPPLLAGLWKVIRDFQPDYLFCPPIPENRLAGVHLDHLAIAESMRQVAFLVNVPHVFTPEYPSTDEPPAFIRTPVILNVFDPYMFGNDSFDLAVQVNDAFDAMARMSWCHQSQIMEWLPWVGGAAEIIPRDFEDWTRILRDRYLGQNQAAGIDSGNMYEFFTLTAWGARPTLDQLLGEIPGVDLNVSRIAQLRDKLARIQIH